MAQEANRSARLSFHRAFASPKLEIYISRACRCAVGLISPHPYKCIYSQLVGHRTSAYLLESVESVDNNSISVKFINFIPLVLVIPSIR